MTTAGRTFRDLLRTEPYVFTGGVYSPLDAQIAERVGLKAIYLSGYSVALANGWPDMGFLTQTEVARTAHMVAAAVSLPGIYQGGPRVAVVVGLTMFLVVMVGSLIGMSLPLSPAG